MTRVKRRPDPERRVIRAPRIETRRTEESIDVAGFARKVVEVALVVEGIALPAPTTDAEAS